MGVYWSIAHFTTPRLGLMNRNVTRFSFSSYQEIHFDPANTEQLARLCYIHFTVSPMAARSYGYGVSKEVFYFYFLERAYRLFPCRYSDRRLSAYRRPLIEWMDEWMLYLSCAYIRRQSRCLSHSAFRSKRPPSTFTKPTPQWRRQVWVCCCVSSPQQSHKRVLKVEKGSLTLTWMIYY